MDEIYEFVIVAATQHPLIATLLGALGGLVVIAQIVVAITPTKKDDEALEQLAKGPVGKVLDFLKRFAPLKK